MDLYNNPVTCVFSQVNSWIKYNNYFYDVYRNNIRKNIAKTRKFKLNILLLKIFSSKIICWNTN